MAMIARCYAIVTLAGFVVHPLRSASARSRRPPEIMNSAMRRRSMKNIRQRFTGMRFKAPALVAAMIAAFAVGGAINFTSHRRPQSLIPAVSASNGVNEYGGRTTGLPPHGHNRPRGGVRNAAPKKLRGGP